MSLVLLEGWDDGLYAQRWTYAAPAPTVSGRARSGRSLHFGLKWQNVIHSLKAADQHATMTVGWWMIADVLPTAGPSASTAMFKANGSSAYHVGVGVTGTGQLQVYRGDGTVLGTTDIVFPAAGAARYIEVQMTLHDTAGSVKIWADGAVVIDLSGIDTKNGGAGSVFDQIRFWNDDNFPLYYVNAEIDDIYITNGNGAAPYNGRLGDIIVETLSPNGNGNYSDFLGSDADKVDNYLLVDEMPTHDGDTTYVESGVDTERESYGFTDLPYASALILGVQATAIVRNLGAADNTQVSARIAGSDYDGATQTVPGTFGHLDEIWQTSPASGSDWTIAEVNAAEFGIENVA